ncbi:MAG: Nucleoside-diphosphate-sugar epimerase [candidate division TM6 bacterium GW2011_GWF2_28_16]|nr:MAG: Nucleoside-diphosphate-sugar epimerase [candidate division TM6 bacterium GW2011_GWF2_28_16]
MNINSKIYIAGHTGLVGSNILNKLKNLGYKNIITRDFKDLDLINQQAVEDFFEKYKPEYVFLAAARVGGIWANNTYKAEFIYDNLIIAANIIHASYKYGVKKLLNLGSSCIYPKLAPQPLKEEYLLSGYLEATNEPYAIAKIAAIKLCRYYNEQYNTNFISVMPTNLYGPNDNFNLETGHVLPVLIRKFYLAKLLQENNLDLINKNLNLNLKNIKDIEVELAKFGIYKNKIILWGSGNVYREFLHVSDLVEALIFLMQNYDYKDIGEIINIGTGIDLTIKDLANLIKNISGFAGDIVFDNIKPDGTPQKLLDVSRIKSLGWQPKILLKYGVKQVYESYINLWE